MKYFNKIILFVICAVAVFALSGCTDDASVGTSKTMFKQMQKQGIVSKNYKEIDTVTKCYWPSEHCQCTTYYIYRDDSWNLMAINYSKAGSSSGYNYMVTIYPNIENIGHIEYLKEKPSCGWDTTYYTYKDGSVSYVDKYNVKYFSEKYGVNVKKSFLSEKYTFKKIELFK